MGSGMGPRFWWVGAAVMPRVGVRSPSTGQTRIIPGIDGEELGDLRNGANRLPGGLGGKPWGLSSLLASPYPSICRGQPHDTWGSLKLRLFQDCTQNSTGHGSTPQQEGPLPTLKTSQKPHKNPGSCCREAVAAQSRQLLWRC